MGSSSAARAVVGVIFCLVATASPARAVSEFPRNIQSDLALTYDPPCRLCHIQGTTGAGSVETPFGLSMLAHGLTTDRTTLSSALAALRVDRVDSDGDGVPDITELMANTDPNTPVNAPLSSEGPTYGCSTSGTNGGNLAACVALAMVIAGTTLSRRPKLGVSRSAMLLPRAPSATRTPLRGLSACARRAPSGKHTH
jgi:hypothetical protein